jgi:uncharacterized membrane protein YdjX (TVP38/TMEM64 family)
MTPTPDAPRAHLWKNRLGWIPEHGLSVVLVVVLMGLVFWVFDLDEIRALIERSGIWGPFIFIIAKAATVVVAPISGSAIYPMAGAIFGFMNGFLYTFIGDALGSTIAFYLSRTLGQKVALRMLGTKDTDFVLHILEYLTSWRGLIEARILFAALPEAVAYTAGLSDIPFWRFFLVQMAVAVPTIAVLVQFGSLFSISGNPLVVGLLLGLSLLVMLGGGALFAYQVKKRIKTNRTKGSLT